MSQFNPEDAILKSLMQDGASYWRIAETVCPDDFSPKARRLFVAIADAVKAGEASDAVTLADTLGDELGREAMDIGFSAMGAVANIESYAKLVAERGEARRVKQAGQRIALAGSYSEAQELLAAVRPQQTGRIKTATDGLREMMEAMQSRFMAESVVTGCPTGLASLDEITGGWQEGDLIGVGGSTSMGKTAFALQAAIAAGRCYYASLEMMAAQLYERVVSNVGHIPYRYIRFPREAPDEFIQQGGSLFRATKDAGLLPLIVDDQPGVTVDQLCSRARQLHMVEPLRLIVVDHLNLIRRPRKNDAAELGDIAISLKNLAKELRVPVMLLVQLNRAGGKGRPELDAFRNSGEIEEALDTALFVYRDEYHNPTGPLAGRLDSSGQWQPGYAEFIIRKQRQGERNVTAWAQSHLSQMRFESCDEPAGNAPTNGGGGGGQTRFTKSSQPDAMALACGDR